ncbi:MAG TPA: GxxExxY protein [Ottowia sp.]|uniref:GxxExxY protein n=1 Tax=Ottowia sp. TaxID=1898956 RepID=UPI002B9CA6C1|nr:GxxExxY protein [Ottowia sp.]HMN21977.1 GxxExxY protein [Ottowia sp.]
MTALQTQQPDAKDAKDSRRTQKNTNFNDDFSHPIIGAAVEVQRVLGVGLLESAYANALAHELTQRGLRFQREVPIKASYKGLDIGIAYRADFIIEDSVVVELKAQDAVADAHRAQLLTYLRLSGLPLGLLINFHVFPVVKGIHRLVNKL